MITVVKNKRKKKKEMEKDSIAEQVRRILKTLRFIEMTKIFI